MSRASQALLWAGGMAVALLMAYTLIFDLRTDSNRERGAGPVGDGLSVAVFYPEPILWRELSQGVRICAGRGLLDIVSQDETRIVVRLHRTRRQVEFVLHDVRGVHETQEELRRVGSSRPTPLAVVGSSNTMLTVALATTLRDLTGQTSPLLLIPWASTVQTERVAPAEGPRSLLEFHPGRTFRFCLNNQLQADLVVNYLIQGEQGERPQRAILIEDRFDPYSVDLSNSFHRAVQHVAPAAVISERSNPLLLPVASDSAALPSAPEEALAESIWREAEAVAGHQATWVFLPLQEEPARRLVQALRKSARRSLPGKEVLLRVICGDAITMPTLSQFAGRVPFPVYSVSSTAMRSPARGVSPDALVPAEIVAALADCIDRPGGEPVTAETLRRALETLQLGPDDPRAVGRTLAFRRSGERMGEDLGMILIAPPHDTHVQWVSRGTGGRWRVPEPVPAEILAAWP